MDVHRRKLRYRAWHRGFREADLILGPFADSHLEAMSPDELAAFEDLLEQPDQDLYDWIVEAAEPPPALDGGMLAMIRDFRHSARHAFER
jgi:antitoxin CptB